MIIYLPLLACIAGLVVYLAASNPKPVELGRLLFGCGLLVALFQVATKSIDLLK